MGDLPWQARPSPRKPGPTPCRSRASAQVRRSSLILIVAGLIVIGAGLRSTANIVGPLFLVITLVITVAPLRNLLVRRRWPSWLASAVSLLTIYALLVLILGSVAFAVARLVGTLPEYERV